MKKLEIVQLDPDELSQMIRAIVRDEINKAIKESNLESIVHSRLLNKTQICERLNISKTQFDIHRTDLILHGLFQMGGKGSEYRMLEQDLSMYLNTLKDK